MRWSMLEKLSIRILVSVFVLIAFVGEGPFSWPLLKDAGAALSSQIQFAQAGSQATQSEPANSQPEPAGPPEPPEPKDTQSGEAASQAEPQNVQPDAAAAQSGQAAAQPEPAKVQPARQGAGADSGTLIRRSRRPSVMPRRPPIIMGQSANTALQQSRAEKPRPETRLSMR